MVREYIEQQLKKVCPPGVHICICLAMGEVANGAGVVNGAIMCEHCFDFHARGHSVELEETDDPFWKSIRDGGGGF